MLMKWLPNLHYVAYEVGRFSAQRMIDNLIENGIEPMIESILER